MMRGIHAFGVALWLAAVLAPAGAASEVEEPTRILDEATDALGLPFSDKLKLGDPSQPSESSSDDGAGGPDGRAAVAGFLVVPVQFVGKGLLDLGLEIIAGLLLGVRGGAETFVAATEVIAASPQESLAIAATAIALIGLASSLAVGFQRYGGLAAIPLFSRITKSELLDNGVRNNIFELIKANPGINVSEIGRRLSIAWGTTTHHLHKLRQERLVAIRVVAHQKCYFQNGGAYTPQEMDVLSATKNPTARRIAELLVQGGPQSHGEITRGVGVSPALVTFHMEKLVNSGVVARHREGRRTIFTPLETNLQPQPRPATHL